jgi:hypothetical protein
MDSIGVMQPSAPLDPLHWLVERKLKTKNNGAFFDGGDEDGSSPA